MIVVRIGGGLGNQMFQYAVYRELYEKHPDVYYETFTAGPHHNGFEINKIFNILEKPVEEISLLNNLPRYQQDRWCNYYPEIFQKNNVHLLGTWANPNYFPAENILRSEFIFKQELDSGNKELLKEIQESNSVSIHVRKGDYTALSGIFFQADWFNYYAMAVDYIAKNAKNKPLKFFVFSDDINWCKKNFMIPVTYVENIKKEAWKDMYLMSNCKHNITANSTFSWWAAWLNTNIEKITITPKIWLLDGKKNELIISDNLIKI